MADELDDIFGAIDGDEEVVESEADEQIEEDGEEDEDANDSMGEPEDDEEKDGDNNSTTKQEKQQKMADTTTTKLYNSIMYAPTTTSNLRNDPQQKGASASELMIPREAVQKKKEEEAEQHAATNAVNTGTSHDKSVRSYSSYPKKSSRGNGIAQTKEGRQTREGISVQTRSLSGPGHPIHRQGGIGVGGGAHVCGENSRRGIRYRKISEQRAACRLYQSHQGTEQSKIPGTAGGIWRCGANDRRHNNQSHRDVSCNDHGNSSIYALSRFRAHERSSMGHL